MSNSVHFLSYERLRFNLSKRKTRVQIIIIKRTEVWIWIKPPVLNTEEDMISCWERERGILCASFVFLQLLTYMVFQSNYEGYDIQAYTTYVSQWLLEREGKPTENVWGWNFTKSLLWMRPTSKQLNNRFYQFSKDHFLFFLFFFFSWENEKLMRNQ